MKRYLSAVFVFGLMTILTVGVFYLSGKTNFNHQTSTNETVNNSAVKPTIEDLAKLPLIFEKNQGQTDEQVKFMSRGAGCTLFLTESEAVLTLQNTAQKEQTGKQSAPQAEVSVLRMKTVGGNSPSKIEGQDEQIAKSNYFIGEDEQKWLRDVPNYGKIRYSEIYSGVDLVYYGKGRQLEYDFIVQPNADPKQIAIEFEGAKSLGINNEGDLVLELESGLIKQHKPIVYQESNGERREIAGNYILKDETQIGFEVGEYDASKPLVIDPVLSYATYLGSREYEFSNGIAVDAAGNSYITGYAVPPSFPTTPGSVRPSVSNEGSLFPFVAKFNSTGTALVYSTYLGGAGEGIAVDAEGNAYTTGYSHPETFTTTPGALDMGRGGVGVTKLNPQGNQRIYAARFGSSGSDTAREIAIDAQGNAVVVGQAGCYTSCDFPILNAAQPTPPTQGGGGFVAKLNATGSALIYSTYLGTGTEEIWGVDTDAAGNAYVTGNTQSFNFPTTPGAFDRTFACPDPPFCKADSFVTKIPAAGGAYAYSTYLGGRGDERGWAIAVDDAGNAYAAGGTDGRFAGFPDEGFPTTPGAFKMFGSVDAYVTKLNPAGTALVYSTLLGGSDGANCFEERARGIDVDRLGQAYVVGKVDCNTFPVVNALQPAPASFQAEAFLTKFNAAGSALVYSTYLGGPRYDEGYDVAVDASGSAYVTGTTSGDFQLITPGAFDTTWNCPNGNCEHPDDIFVMKVTDRLPLTQFDFDGDGKADIGAFRPSNANWYIANSASNSTSQRQFGLSGDLLAPADYDGDGKTDIAVFRSNEGVWYRINSATNTVSIMSFGASGDIPVPSDFDGDGKADVAVFRPTTGVWWIFRSLNNSIFAQQFGISEDKPTLGDFDGDGKADLAVFRPSAGVWYHLRSSNNQFFAYQFGLSSDTPTPADFDGDGKTDIAVFRSSTGVWYRLNSLNNSVTVFQFGLVGDKPVAADYDGDGKADIAVFRPTESIWYLQRSAQGFVSRQFGAGDDLPISNAFIR
jgi:hypothetical protein